MYKFEIKRVGNGYVGVLIYGNTKQEIWSTRSASSLSKTIQYIRQKSYTLAKKGMNFEFPDFELLKLKDGERKNSKPADWDNTCYTLTPEEYYERLKAEGRSIKNLK
ncbi:hypothetical protein NYR72_10095 [Actinobacillus equuli subsp. haemolyticus]|uniref:hypothetical protein n=1 Tax=Actinobacillus equuli TaxID=718 RepID=UPI00241894E4|nr:hypothetical protein [Actinobacillus equuli]MDG4948842.1 hypothetical protein [Actinobacillus equuli subsp. haemolyticus]